jgi:mannose-1-phosphate guanylyltransferase/phosphomannomutase
VGENVKVEGGAVLGERTVLGSNVVVKGGAVLERAIVHDNVFIGANVGLRGCVIGKSTDLMRASRVEEGAVVGDECLVEEEAFVSQGVKVYPYKTIDAGAVVRSSVIWESRGAPSTFGPRGLSGLVNVEITAESWCGWPRLRDHAQAGERGHGRGDASRAAAPSSSPPRPR